MNSNTETYWIVVGSAPASFPYRHTSEVSAKKEARRLAGAYSGTTFTVFQSIADYASVAIQENIHQAPMPF